MKWKSKYSPGRYISTHQYILEIVCENKAVKDKVDLPFQFWKLPKWKWEYIKNSNSCKILRKTHGDLKVLDFVKKNRIWNLSAKWIDGAIAKWNYNAPQPKNEDKIINKNTNSIGKKPSPKTDLFKGL